MPELPEVETVARSLAPHVIDCRFVDFELLRAGTLLPSSLPLSRLCGLKIGALSRRGKLLVFSLCADNDSSQNLLSLVIHLRMTGRIFTRQANEGLGKHTRCVFSLEKPAGEKIQLFFDDTRTFGKIMLADSQILGSWPFWRDMGPEPFDMSVQDLKNVLTGRRPLKNSLLDQSVLAGIGNIYADETLFTAKLHPLRQSGSLTFQEVQNLHAAIGKVLTEAIAKKGSSIRDYRDADGRQGTFQKFFMVYGRGGENCKECGSRLQKIRIGGRATVFCPVCQRAPEES